MHRLADPPCRIGRELEATAPVELLDGANETDDPFLDQVEQREAVTLVLLRNRHDETEVRVHHPVLRRLVARLDELGELDLLRGGEQRVAARFVEEELERVARHRGDLRVRVRRLLDLGEAAVVGDLDALLRELLVEVGDLVVVHVELLEERRERGQVDAAQLLAVLHQRFQLLVTHAISIPGNPWS